MFHAKILVGAFSIVVVLFSTRAAALDVIVEQELKDTAIQYGRYSGRFITCDIRPPVRIRTAFLKYARSRGASDHHLEMLSKVFDDGQARTTGLRSGFSKQECEAKLAEPQGQKLLEQLEEWYALPPHLKN